MKQTDPLASLPFAEDQAPPSRPVELLISTLLRVGVSSSLLLLMAGTLLSFIHHPSYLVARGQMDLLMRPAQTVPHRLSDVAYLLSRGRGQGVVMLGLLVLIATPIMRVLLSVVVFWQERDRLFAAITMVVFALLILSLVMGRSG